MDCKYNATHFELLMRLYISDKPIHGSYFAEESLTTGKDLFSNLNLLIEKGFVEKIKIFQTDIESPFFRISNSGKELVEKIMNNFPMNE